MGPVTAFGSWHWIGAGHCSRCLDRYYPVAAVPVPREGDRPRALDCAGCGGQGTAAPLEHPPPAWMRLAASEADAARQTWEEQANARILRDARRRVPPRH